MTMMGDVRQGPIHCTQACGIARCPVMSLAGGEQRMLLAEHAQATGKRAAGINTHLCHKFVLTAKAAHQERVDWSGVFL